VFDGQADNHREDEPLAPLGVYGQTKAAADEIVATLSKFYVLRTSWVIGDGHNFVQTMWNLAKKSVKPDVVNDQIGRLTFTDELARGIKFLLDNNAPFGVYNLTGDGKPAAWNEIAEMVFAAAGRAAHDVSGVSTEHYFASTKTPVAPRPRFSTLDLSKIKTAGFQPRDWRKSLNDYLSTNLSNKEEK
jgi:dTDP-4-dehydrorhamnose 3,5-epimerase